MPGSYPNAVKSIDSIYKVFSQMYINAKNEGTMNMFVCDFLQDENGQFHFLKIQDFGTDGKPTFDHAWKLSSAYPNRALE